MAKHEESTLVVDKLADDLRSKIESGTYGQAGSLPSTTELAREWKTSRSIVTQVMLLLRSEGHIRMVGNRYVVNRPRLILPGLTKNFEQYLKDQGYEPEIENIIEPSVETMTSEVAALFGQQPGMRVIHRMRKQGITNQPLRLAENWYYPADLVEGFLDEMRSNDHMDVVGAISEKYGKYIVETKEDILARIPTKEEMKWLGIARYQPVFEVRRSNFAQDGTPLMFNRIIMVATNFFLSRAYPVEHWKKQSA